MTSYTTVADAKVFARLMSYKDLGFETEDDYTDHINDLIEMCSRRIDRFCHRPDNFFSGGTLGVTVTEYQDGIAERYSHLPALGEREDAYDAYRATFWLRHTPIILVTSIHENEADIGEADSYTAITKYRFNSETGEVRIATGEVPAEGTKNVRFIYTAGYKTGETPVEVEQATATLAGNYIQARAQEYTTQSIHWGRPTPFAIQRPEIFTADIKDMLESYKKKRMAML